MFRHKRAANRARAALYVGQSANILRHAQRAGMRVPKGRTWKINDQSYFLMDGDPVEDHAVYRVDRANLDLI